MTNFQPDELRELTVVMPVYNGAETIVEAIESVLQQSYNKFTLLVVNDGSTDNTAQKLAQITDTRVKRISQPRAGPSAARNLGANAARSKLLAFIDADDVWLPDKLMCQIRALEQHETAAFAYCWVDFTDSHLNVSAPDDRAIYEGCLYRQLLEGNFISSGSNSLVQFDAFHEVGGFNESLLGAEDWEFHTRLAKHYLGVCVPRVLVYYRQSVNSWSTDLKQLESHYHRAASMIFYAAPASHHRFRKHCDVRFYWYVGVRALNAGSRQRFRRAAPLFLKAFTADPLHAATTIFKTVGRRLRWLKAGFHVHF